MSPSVVELSWMIPDERVTLTTLREVRVRVTKPVWVRVTVTAREKP